MDAARVKEVVFRTIDTGISHSGENEQTILYLKHLKKECELWIGVAEAAEQEGWKGLPMCCEERGKEVARAIDPCPWYNYWLCAYHRCQEGDIIFHRCALPIDEPAADSEPKSKLENLRERVGLGKVDNFNKLLDAFREFLDYLIEIEKEKEDCESW